MFRMLNINRINYAFLVWRIAQYGITKPLDTWLHIQLLTHLFQREVSISTSFLQRVHQAPVLAILLDRHIIVQR